MKSLRTVFVLELILLMIKDVHAKRDVLDSRIAFREEWRVYMKYVSIIW